MARLRNHTSQAAKDAAALADAAPGGWIADLERARADVAAGRTCDGGAFLAEIEAEDASWGATGAEQAPRT